VSRWVLGIVGSLGNVELTRSLEIVTVYAKRLIPYLQYNPVILSIVIPSLASRWVLGIDGSLGVQELKKRQEGVRKSVLPSVAEGLLGIAVFRSVHYRHSIDSSIPTLL
jgi:hypothetical protein